MPVGRSSDKADSSPGSFTEHLDAHYVTGYVMDTPEYINCRFYELGFDSK